MQSGGPRQWWYGAAGADLVASSELLFCQTRDTDGRWERADGSVRELRPGVQSDALVVRMAAAGACRAMRWWLGWLRLGVGSEDWWQASAAHRWVGEE